MSDPERAAPQMRAVERIAAILGVFSAATPLLPLSEVARASGLDKNTARRLLIALADTGLVVREGDLYGLGLEVLRMQPAVEAPRALRENAAPWLLELTEAVGMTAFAWLPHESGAICVERASSHRRGFSGVTWSSPGTVMPLNLGAGPRTILAYLSADARAAWLERPQPATTGQSETDPEALEAIAADIRDLGHAWIADDYVVGLAGLGVPVLDRQGALAGSISITGPTHLLADADLRQRALVGLRRAAAEIGLRLV